MGFFTKVESYTDRWRDKQERTTLRLGRVVFIAVLSVILLFMVLSSIAKIPTGHTGVITTFGQVENYTLDSGIHLKWPWQKVIKMDNRVQSKTIELSSFSSDIQEVSMTYTVYYQIDKTNAMTIYSTIGKDYSDKIITPIVNESVKTVSALYTAEELVNSRAELAKGITEELTVKLAVYNIEFVDASIENIDFTDAFTDAVEAKQVAQQNKLKAETEAEQKRVEAQAEADAKLIAAQAEADATLIEAEAKTEANRLLTESLTPEILEKMYYDTWDGKLPTVYGADSTVIGIPNN